MTLAPDHIPVLRDEAIAALAIAEGELHVDATFGAGGYSRAMLAKGAVVHAFDRDPDVVETAQALRADHGERFHFHARRFSEMADALRAAAVETVDGVVFDLGVSSMQLDRAGRGFSFRADGPLDMRMEQDGPSAADLVNEVDEGELADIIYRYGEERASRRIARAIVQARPLTTTAALADTVRSVLGKRPGQKTDPATRTFQAIRIYVNRELGELEDGLAAAEALLKPGGRLAVVSFHSLEDRIVKHFLREHSGKSASGSRHLPDISQFRPAPTFHKPANPVRPVGAEQAHNPRARSATLRAAVRTDAPPLALTGGAP